MIERRNCFNCKYYECYGPSYNLKLDKELCVCFKGVNIERRDPVKFIEDPEEDKECFVSYD